MDSTFKELLKSYLEKAERKLKVTERLLESNDYGNAISRAYYAVYQAAQALLLTEGQRAEDHKGVVTLFSLLFVKTGKFSKNLGKYLSNLKDDREASDYEVFSYIDHETAEEAVKEAREFIVEAKKYLMSKGIMI